MEEDRGVVQVQLGHDEARVGRGQPWQHWSVRRPPAGGYSLQLETKVREDFTIMEKAPTRASPG